ncbi:site-specific integrase [Metamycoplasma equirhinis]|uniref:site-specific integrase n=1 Tax=Metamycoplasma equirhinis TaxID=92402 RepID=UPI00359C14A3
MDNTIFQRQINLFLNTNYKNSLTRKNAQIALKRIEYLGEINIDKINKIYNSIPTPILSGSSKNTELAYIRKFIRKISEIEGKFYDTSKLITFEDDSKPKQVFNEEELKQLDELLIKFDNPQFKLIFDLLKYNGCRLGEFFMVNWEDISKNNYEEQIKAKKHGRNRTIVVPDFLKYDFDCIGITYSYNTVQNLFAKFQKFVKQMLPDWRKPISAHVLRAQLITNMHICGLSVDKIQVVTGHIEGSTITNHYIKTSPVYQKQLLELGNMQAIDSMEINKLNEIIMKQNQQIIYLKEQLLIKDNEISNLKRLRNKNHETKNANIFRSKNEHKIFAV